MFSCQGSFRKMLLCALGVSIVSAAAPSSAVGSDKIAVNAKSVFGKAGGHQQIRPKPKAIAGRRCHHCRCVGPLDPRRHSRRRRPRRRLSSSAILSKKETITYAEFLDYFRGLVSEQDLKFAGRWSIRHWRNRGRPKRLLMPQQQRPGGRRPLSK